MGIGLYLKWCVLKNIAYLFCAGGRAIKEVTKSCYTFCFNDNKSENVSMLDTKKTTKSRIILSSFLILVLKTISFLIK